MAEPGDRRDRGLLAIGSWRERARALATRAGDGAGDSMVRLVAARADRILARLEATSEVLDKVARTELRILEKLEPIVDDLGQLVRAQLAQTLGRAPRVKEPEGEVIDVTDE